MTAASWNRVLGANQRVGIGVIGFGLVGRIHTRNFKAQPGAQVVAVSETFRPRMDAAAELVGGHVMLEDPVVVQGTRALHLRYPVRR